MDRAKVESFVVDLLERHCGPKAAQSANTRRHFTDAILAGSATPDTVRAQILQLAQTQQMAQHIIQASPPTSPLILAAHTQPQPQQRAPVADGVMAPSRPPAAASIPRPVVGEAVPRGGQPVPSSASTATTAAAPAHGGHVAWTKDEQKRFFEGYELFGVDDVDNIRAHVETRSMEEVRRFLREYLDYLEAKRQQVKREREERERLQREREKEERVRQIELELQRERAALASKTTAVGVGDSADEARLEREIADEDRRDEALIRQFEAQTLEDANKDEAQQLRELQEANERERQAIEREREMERRVLLLQQQLAAEKARMELAKQRAVPPTTTPSTPQHQPQQQLLFSSSTATTITSPAHASTSMPRSSAVPRTPLPTTVTSQSLPAASAATVTARPTQFTFSKSRAAPQPAPTSLTEYELLFNNVSLSVPPPTSSSPLSSSSSSASSSSLPYVVPASASTLPYAQPHAAAATRSYDAAPGWGGSPSTASLPSGTAVGNQPRPSVVPAPQAPTTFAQTASPPASLPAPAADLIPNLTPLSTTSASASEKNAKFEYEQVKQFVTELYRVYTGGKLPDPATFRWHVDSVMNGSYSLTQAEYSIRFSKDAKEYARQQTLKKDAQVHQIQEYVKELMRVYCKRAPTAEEMKLHVEAVLSGQSNLQQVEDEVRLLGLAAPPVGRPPRS